MAVVILYTWSSTISRSFGIVRGHLLMTCTLSYFQPCLCPESVKENLTKCLSELIYFDEIAVAFTRMQTECRDFIASLKQQGIDLESDYPSR